MGTEAGAFISEFLESSGRDHLVLDGGLGTELERHGADTNDPLWSAKCLIQSPHLIRTGIRNGSHAWRPVGLACHMQDLQRLSCVAPRGEALGALRPCNFKVHLDYLDAGANVITSASYQATIQGFEAKGLSRAEAEALLRRSVEIAREARDIYYNKCTKGYWDNTENGSNAKRPILVAASVGGYGAYLADGSEYSGNYGEGVTVETLKDFHRRRVQVLAESGADLLAFETIPNKLEAKAYAELLEEEDIKIPAWFSFTSKDGINVSSGDSLLECAAIADSCKNVAAVGINCTAPRFIHGLILSLRKATDKPIVIYPNSGETYDGIRKEWMKSSEETDEESFVSYVRKWHEIGASLIGGCCRTTPNTIRAIANALSQKTAQPN